MARGEFDNPPKTRVATRTIAVIFLAAAVLGIGSTTALLWGQGHLEAARTRRLSITLGVIGLLLAPLHLAYIVLLAFGQGMAVG